MGIFFKHKIKKQAIFYNDLVPGRSSSGPNGSAGKNGKNGPSIYFADYTPDDDYVKKIILDKISQGLFLTSDSDQKLVGISYTPGDLIITEKKYVYKLILNNGEYDLKFLGQFVSKQQSVEEQGKTYLLDSLINVEINNLIKREQYLPVPTNRGMESRERLSTETVVYTYDASGYLMPNNVVTDSCRGAVVNYSYNDALKIAFGFDFYPIIRIEEGSNVFNDYDFYLKIKMKNKKSPQGASYTLEDNDTGDFISPKILDPSPENMYNAFVFHKYSEIKLKIFGQNQTPDSSSRVMSDGFARCSINDMSCDKLHPSGNNIASNIVDSSYTYTEGEYPINPGALSTLHVIDYRYIVHDSSLYRRPGSERDTEKATNRSEIYNQDKKMFRSTKFSDTLGFLQYSKRKGSRNYLPNFRAGDSAFFSGIVKQDYNIMSFPENEQWNYNSSHTIYTAVSFNNSYSNFANHVNCMTHPFQGDTLDVDSFQKKRLQSEQLYVVDSWLYPFYFDSNNIYELICVNKKTGETYNMNLRKIVIT